MAYLGKKTGQQLLAAENRKQALLLRQNADLLHSQSKPMKIRAAQMRSDADRLIAEADALEVTP